MKIVIPDSVQKAEVDGQIVLLDCRKNYYYAVSKSGAEFIEQIQSHGDMQQAIQWVSEIYQVPYERVEKDMISFTRHLEEKGLVMVK